MTYGFITLQMRLMGECRGSIDAVKRTEEELTEDEDEMPGLNNPISTDSQSSGQLPMRTSVVVIENNCLNYYSNSL